MSIENDDCCLDTSAVEEVLLKRKSSALFSDFIAKTDLVIAHTLMITEATNVFWKYQKFSEIPYAEMPLTCCYHSVRRALARSCRIQLFLKPFFSRREKVAVRTDEGFGNAGLSLPHPPFATVPPLP